MGIETIFVIRGDKPRNTDGFQPHPDAMAYASDLISFLRGRFDLCFGAAGYPEGHIEAENKEKDLEYLKLKVDQGAQYVIAQYVYDVDTYFDFAERARAIGIAVPILPGIMPIYSEKLTRNLAKVCGASIPDAIESGLAALDPEDKSAVARYGIDVATEQCRAFLKRGVPGLHFYTMNRSKTVVEVVRRLKGEGLLA